MIQKHQIINRKFIESYNIDDFEIETDTGWVDIKYLHKTIPYIKYEIKTEKGLYLTCADDHILFDNNMNEIFVKELQINNIIQTKYGLDKIIYINKLNDKENMYDFELSENSNHRYYTNDILSHNTYLAKTIAKIIDVPFCICDATTLTESGYVGEDVESILTRLLQASDYDVERAERGIVFIDEIDKIARKSDNPSITRDVSGEGVQQGLLKLLEGSIVLCPPNGGRKHPDQKMIPVDTKNILFICGGAFVGLDKKISQRFNQQSVGFGATQTRMNKFDEENILSKVTPIDLKSFGLIPEIIGRLPVLTYMEPLNKEALLKILKEPKNALIKQYQKLFEIDGVELKFEDDALDYIVEETEKYKLGARGLRGIMEDIMTKAMFNMPSEETKEFTITLDYVKERLENK